MGTKIKLHRTRNAWTARMGECFESGSSDVEAIGKFVKKYSKELGIDLQFPNGLDDAILRLPD